MQDEFEIINGGVELEVELHDNTKAVVKVRQLPLRRLGDYHRARADEGALLELLTDKPADWGDSLKAPWDEKIVELGYELNEKRYFNWAKRRLEEQERLVPLNPRASDLAKSVLPSA